MAGIIVREGVQLRTIAIATIQQHAVHELPEEYVLQADVHRIVPLHANVCDSPAFHGCALM